MTGLRFTTSTPGVNVVRITNRDTGEAFDLPVNELFLPSWNNAKMRSLTARRTSPPSLPELPDYVVAVSRNGGVFTKTGGHWYMTGSTSGTYRFASDDELWEANPNAKIRDPYRYRSAQLTRTEACELFKGETQ